MCSAPAPAPMVASIDRPAQTEGSHSRIVRIALEVPPVLFRIGRPRSRLKQKHVEPATRKLFRDDCSASSGSNNDNVTHNAPLSPYLAAVLKISQELVSAVRYALVTRKVPRDRVSCQGACHWIEHRCLRVTEESDKRR